MNAAKFKMVTASVAGCGMVLISLVLLNGCYKDKAEKLYPGAGGTVCDTLAMKYAVNIQPILTTNCAVPGCHTTLDKPSAGGYAYDSHAETMVTVTSGKLLKSIKHLPGASAMPKGAAKMERCNIDKINAWVNQGALNN